MGFWSGSWAGSEHRERGFDGPISSCGEAQMARTTPDGKSETRFRWLGTNSPDDKRGKNPGKLARRSK